VSYLVIVEYVAAQLCARPVNSDVRPPPGNGMTLSMVFYAVPHVVAFRCA
jgi:hypothetical protein